MSLSIYKFIYMHAYPTVNKIIRHKYPRTSKTLSDNAVMITLHFFSDKYLRALKSGGLRFKSRLQNFLNGDLGKDTKSCLINLIFFLLIK